MKTASAIQELYSHVVKISSDKFADLESARRILRDRTTFESRLCELSEKSDHVLETLEKITRVLRIPEGRRTFTAHDALVIIDDLVRA